MDPTVEDNAGSGEALLTDRRRPNRQDFENPHLIALLRGEPGADRGLATGPATPVAQPGIASEDDRNGLAGARGIAFALLFGAVMWALMALLWRLV